MPDRSRRDTLARQWELLRLLPSRPPGCTAAELTRSLAEKGMPFGWYWIRDADLGIPGVELTEALSFTLLRDFLQGRRSTRNAALVLGHHGIPVLQVHYMLFPLPFSKSYH